MKKHFLYLAVFFTGAINLGFEMIIVRLCAPFFGVSNLVWAVIISVVLLYISIGSMVGGKLVDQHGSDLGKYKFILISSGAISMIIVLPLYYLLKLVFYSHTLSFVFFILIFILSILIFSLPVLLNSILLPVVTRILSQDKKDAGKIIGRVYAVNTGGAIFGALFSVLIFIPIIGIKWSIYIIFILLLLLLLLLL